MYRTLTIALLSTTLALVACTKSAQPAPAKPAEPTAAAAPAKPAEPATPAPAGAAPGNSELENKGIAMLQRMADLFVSDEKDCEKLAVDLKAFIAQNKGLITELNQLEHTQTEQQKATFEANNKGVQQALVERMKPALTACGSNPKVQAAMQDFPSD
jgi:hypothetical protein